MRIMVVASVVDFYSNDPSSNPAEATVFAVTFVFEKNEKRGRGCQPMIHNWWSSVRPVTYLLDNIPIHQKDELFSRYNNLF